MVLEFDVGNTALKWRLLDAAGAIADRGNLASIDQLPDIVARVAAASRVRVASVAGDEVAATLKTWSCETLGVTPEFARTLEGSGKVAQQLNEDLISTEHLLLGLLSNRQVAKFLDKGHKVTIEMQLRGREKEHKDRAKEIINS